MISWMQKHNKYLVWTIWIATIAFIGAGFVGWGSYNLGSKSGTVAQVGSIDIKQGKLNNAYGNLYNQYNQMMDGKLDKKKAEELGLVKQAFSTLEVQAKVLNFAKDAGIIASDEELVSKLGEIKGFQKDGIFSREIYDNYLKSQHLKAKDFEATLKEEIVIKKTLALLDTTALPLEIETVGAAMNVADQLVYKVLSTADVNQTVDAAGVKSYWENQKENFMTKKSYDLSIVWTSSDKTEVSEEDVKAYYEANSFNYTDKQGKQLDFNSSRAKATKDLKVKNTKKSAQKSYIAFKKGKMKSSEDIKLSLGDLKLTSELWNTIESKGAGEILKPKLVGLQYATVKINKIIEPAVMTFDQAKDRATTLYGNESKKKALLTLSETTLTKIDESNESMTDYITLEKHDQLKLLNSQESLQFIQKLFTSDKEKGIISVADKVVVYSIVNQKILPTDENSTKDVNQTVNSMKKKIFESNLVKMLDSIYPTKTYMEGLKN